MLVCAASAVAPSSASARPIDRRVQAVATRGLIRIGFTRDGSAGLAGRQGDIIEGCSDVSSVQADSRSRPSALAAGRSAAGCGAGRTTRPARERFTPQWITASTGSIPRRSTAGATPRRSSAARCRRCPRHGGLSSSRSSAWAPTRRSTRAPPAAPTCSPSATPLFAVSASTASTCSSCTGPRRSRSRKPRARAMTC